MESARPKDTLRDAELSHLYLVTLVVWIMRAGSLNQRKLRLPMMGWRIRSRESLWVLVLFYYPESGTGWWWDQIPHCRWGRCTGSCHRSSHTGPPRTAPGSSHTRSRLRKTGEEGNKGPDTYTQAWAQQGHGKVTQNNLYDLIIERVIQIQLTLKKKLIHNFIIIHVL